MTAGVEPALATDHRKAAMAGKVQGEMAFHLSREEGVHSDFDFFLGFRWMIRVVSLVNGAASSSSIGGVPVHWAWMRS